ncbi:MAG: zinc-binding dehydrogenase [Oscillospiraceae bacterium]|nr:zinc-binding dehydrogenase [Oscillospiraceae bacterium]
MKAMIYSKNPAPAVLRLTEVEKPVPAAGQVLVKIHSVSLNAADYRSMQMGIGPKSGIFGADIAGSVEAVGPIDRRYSLPEAEEAFEYLKAGHAGGKVVINVIS